MASDVFENLLIEQIKIFQNAFSKVAKDIFYDETKRNRSIHPEEFGRYREAICVEFLKFFVPSYLDFGTGFLINAHNKTSSQCDIIIYDPTATPFLKPQTMQRFFPVESVLAVGEVKSTIQKKAELKEYLHKLAQISQLRDNPQFIFRNRSILPEKAQRSNKTIPLFEQLFTFLICQKFDFKLNPSELDELYGDDILQHHRHNLILSIEDGLLAYVAPQEKGDKIINMITPFQCVLENQSQYLLEQACPNVCVPPNSHQNDPYLHFKLFINNIFIGLKAIGSFYPDIGLYMKETHSFRFFVNTLIGRKETDNTEGI